MKTQGWWSFKARTGNTSENLKNLLDHRLDVEKLERPLRWKLHGVQCNRKVKEIEVRSLSIFFHSASFALRSLINKVPRRQSIELTSPAKIKSEVLDMSLPTVLFLSGPMSANRNWSRKSSNVNALSRYFSHKLHALTCSKKSLSSLNPRHTFSEFINIVEQNLERRGKIINAHSHACLANSTNTEERNLAD